MQPFLLAIFLIGYVLLATLGAWTRLAFQWPGYLVLAVGGLLALVRLRKGFRFSPSGLCLVSTIVFVVYLAARAWFSPVEYLARQDLLPLAACLIGYTLFALHVEHPRYRRWFAVVLTVLVLVNFGIGVYQAQYDRTWSPYHWLGYARVAGPANAGGFFHSENHLAGFLEGSLYFLAAFALFARIKLVWRMAAIFSLMLGLVVLVLTYSRAGIASAGVGLAAFGALTLWLFGKFLGPQFWKYVVAFGALFTLLGGFLAFLCWDFLSGTYRTPDGVAGDGQFRMAYTELAIDQWKTSPVWGTGARTFGLYAREMTSHDDDWMGAQAVDPDIAHNDYAQLLGDYGGVGFALGMILLLVHLGNGLRFLAWYRNVRFDRTGDLFSNSLALALGSVCAVVAYMAHSAIDFNLHIPANALLMAAIFGILANPGFESDGRRRLRIPGLKSALTLLAAAGSLWTLWLGWRAAPAEVAYQQGLTRTQVFDYLGALTPHRRAAELDAAHFPNRMGFGAAYVGLAGEEEIPELAVSWREKAIEQFRAAVALNPRDALAHVNLAEQLSQTGPERAAEAEVHYLEAMRRAPALVVLRGRYGFHLLRHGQVDKAADVWEETLQRKWYDADSLMARRLLEKIREAQRAGVPSQATDPATPVPVPAPVPLPEALPPAAAPPGAVTPSVPVPVPVPVPGPEMESPAPEPGDPTEPGEPPVAPAVPAPVPEKKPGGLLSLPDPMESRNP